MKHQKTHLYSQVMFFPTCQVRVVRFYHSCSASSSSSFLPSFLPSFRPSVLPSFRPSFLPSFLPPSSLLPSSPIFIANLLRQSASPICFADLVWQAPDRSVQPWTSTARIRSQCAPLDLNRKDPIAVCTPGPQPQGSERSVHPWNQPQGSDRSVHPWTSTARIRSQCASLDLNRKDPIAVCTAGPQPEGSDRSVHRWTSTARIRSQCAPLDLNQIVCQIKCQIECQVDCQIECCKKICQIVCQIVCQIDC